MWEVENFSDSFDEKYQSLDIVVQRYSIEESWRGERSAFVRATTTKAATNNVPYPFIINFILFLRFLSSFESLNNCADANADADAMGVYFVHAKRTRIRQTSNEIKRKTSRRNHAWTSVVYTIRTNTPRTRTRACRNSKYRLRVFMSYGNRFGFRFHFFLRWLLSLALHLNPREPFFFALYFIALDYVRRIHKYVMAERAAGENERGTYTMAFLYLVFILLSCMYRFAFSQCPKVVLCMEMEGREEMCGRRRSRRRRRKRKLFVWLASLRAGELVRWWLACVVFINLCIVCAMEHYYFFSVKNAISIK